MIANSPVEKTAPYTHTTTKLTQGLVCFEKAVRAPASSSCWRGRTEIFLYSTYCQTIRIRRKV